MIAASSVFQRPRRNRAFGGHGLRRSPGSLFRGEMNPHSVIRRGSVQWGEVSRFHASLPPVTTLGCESRIFPVAGFPKAL